MRKLIIAFYALFGLSGYTHLMLLQPNQKIWGTSSVNQTISANTTFAAGTYAYQNLTINSGVTLSIDHDGDNAGEVITVIRVNGTLTLNGTISSIRGSHYGGSFATSNIDGVKFQKAINQSSGGGGGSGYITTWGGFCYSCDVGNTGPSSSGYGNGGGGGAANGGPGGCGANDKAYGQSGATPNQGGHGGYGGDRGGAGWNSYGGGIYGSNGNNANSTCGGGDGGGGGARGWHGGFLVIIAKNIVGSGLIDLHGSNGGNGGAGACSYGSGGCGAGGGGGAGGNGGTLWLGSQSNTSSISINLSPGAGGSGGSGNTYGGSGSSGSSGSIVYLAL